MRNSSEEAARVIILETAIVGIMSIILSSGEVLAKFLALECELFLVLLQHSRSFKIAGLVSASLNISSEETIISYRPWYNFICIIYCSE